MKVGRVDGTNVVELYKANLAKGSGNQGAGAPAPSDQADISRKGKDLQSIMSSLKALPDVRGDLVASLKQQVSSGTFKVDAAKVADGMLQEQKLFQEAGKVNDGRP